MVWTGKKGQGIPEAGDSLSSGDAGPHGATEGSVRATGALGQKSRGQ